MKNRISFRLISLCVLAVISTTVAAISQTPTETPTTPAGTVEERIAANVKLVPCKNDERLEAVKALFKSAGATDADMSIGEFKKIKNLLVTKKGKTDEIVIVGAHYDKVSDGCGAIDNWTGIVIISELYQTIRTASTLKTYVFVAFDQEEKGMFGSRAMAEAIPKTDISNYCAMVNLDSFGFTYPQVMDNASTTPMAKLAETNSIEMGLKYIHASIVNADADSSSFRARKIPAITFHGLNGDWARYLHSSNDKAENINANSVIIGYQYTLNFIAKVDKLGCGDLRNDPKPEKKH